MSPELTNLLPHSRLRAFRRLYFTRLGTLALGILTATVLVQVFLLIPTYWYVRAEVGQLKSSVAATDAAAQSSEEQELRTRTEALSATVMRLVRLSEAPVASAAIRAVLVVPRPGIRLVGFTFTAPANGQPARMGISGIAGTRDDLRQYEAALRELSFVERADLPISAYAKESAIPFTIVLTGPLRP